MGKTINDYYAVVQMPSTGNLIDILENTISKDFFLASPSFRVMSVPDAVKYAKEHEGLHFVTSGLDQIVIEYLQANFCSEPKKRRIKQN